MSAADVFPEGPTLESLLRRLAETPVDFLAETKAGGRPARDARPLVADLLRALGAPVHPLALAPFAGTEEVSDRNRIAVTLIVSWMLADAWFRKARLNGDLVLGVLRNDVPELAALIQAKLLVSDPERREELARFILARLNLRPAGETAAQAQDRLMSLSSAERARVLKASQAAMQRAREIREALAKKAADESADKYTRE